MLFVGENRDSTEYRDNVLSEFYTQTGMHYCDKSKGIIIIFADDFRINSHGKRAVKKSLWKNKVHPLRPAPKMML